MTVENIFEVLFPYIMELLGYNRWHISDKLYWEKKKKNRSTVLFYTTKTHFRFFFIVLHDQYSTQHDLPEYILGGGGGGGVITRWVERLRYET